ncbi:MAG: DeoR family transcriptional regulator [Patescibacteria group bacterium]
MDKEILKIASSLCEAIKSLIELEIKTKNLNNDNYNNSERPNSEISEFPNSNADKDEEIDEFGKMNLEVRQLAILEKIKQFSTENDEGCGLKELMTAFPDISDRTLRYDLQKLAAQGSIIKIGNRGPNTIYTLNYEISQH